MMTPQEETWSTQGVVVTLERTPEAQMLQGRLDKLALIQIKSIFLMNDNVKKMRQQTIFWEKNHTEDM